jgi:integrase/recombinase XerD
MRKFVRERSPANIDIPESKPDNYTIDEALEAFILAKEAEGVRSRTVETYRLHIDYLKRFLTDLIYVNDLTPSMIREYVRYLKYEKIPYEGVEHRKLTDKRGLSINSINMRLRTLNTMCQFWHAEGLAKINAMANIKQVRDDQAEEVPGLSDEELAQIYKALDECSFGQYRDRILITLMLDTGLRIGEAVTITEAQIEFTNRIITVPSQVAKNRKNRIIPVSREVLNKLRGLHAECIEYFGEHEEIFMTAYGEPMTPNSFRKSMHRLKQRTGIKRLHPHQFRHTFARNFVLNGGDIFTLQAVLDHAQITTTRKYVQMEHKHIKAQHDKYSPVRKWLRK